MSLAEGVQGTIRYKAYTTGTMTSNALLDISSDPGTSGGQLLRRTSVSINLRKDGYASQEIRSDRQIGDFRHGVRRVEGSVSGEFSPATYFELFAAAHRNSPDTTFTLGASQLTSASLSNVNSNVTFGGGDPVSSGLRVGDIIRFTNLTDVDNNSRNFLITGFSSANNRTVGLYPAPDQMTADTSFSLTRPGKATWLSSSVFVSRKYLIEHYQEDLDQSRLFKECRVTGYRISLPATGMATVEVMVMGRDMSIVSGGSAPFFGSPTAITTPGCLAAVNGALYVNGTRIAVITGIDIEYAMSPDAPAVVGQNFVPEIFLGTARVTGRFTALVEDATLFNLFLNETEASLLMFLEAGTTQPAAACSIYLPRIKATAADLQMTGEASQVVTVPFQALKYQGSTPGIEQTTVRIVDTAAT